MTIHLLKPGKGTTVTYQGELARDEPGHLLIHARWERAKLDLGYVVFEPGDHFLEHYYTEHWFNIFEIRSVAGQLKGWYCNVGAPALVADGQLTFLDFALDVFAYPDRRFVVLDEDEFEQLARTTYRPIEVEAATRALAELTDLAASGRLPGRPFGGPLSPAASL